MRVRRLDGGEAEDCSRQESPASRPGWGLRPLRWVGVLVVVLFSWVGAVEVLLLRWPVAAVVGLLAWELVVQAWWWLASRPLRRVRGLALRAAGAVTTVALLVLPGPVRSLVLSVEGTPWSGLGGVAGRAAALTVSAERLAAVAGVVAAVWLVVRVVDRLTGPPTLRATCCSSPPLGRARLVSTLARDDSAVQADGSTDLEGGGVR